MADQRDPAKRRDKEIIFFFTTAPAGYTLQGKSLCAMPGREPVPVLRHPYLETGTFSALTGLLDRHPGDRQDLPDKEEPKTGIFPVTPVKDDLLLFPGYPDPVVTDEEDKPVLSLLVPYPDFRCRLPVPDDIFHEVGKGILQKRIGIQFQVSGIEGVGDR